MTGRWLASNSDSLGNHLDVSLVADGVLAIVKLFLSLSQAMRVRQLPLLGG